MANTDYMEGSLNNGTVNWTINSALGKGNAAE